MITTSKTHLPSICPVAVAIQGPAALCRMLPRNIAPNRLPHSCLRSLHRAMPAVPSLRPSHGRTQTLENPAHA
jgi:hypothetical protein